MEFNSIPLNILLRVLEHIEDDVLYRLGLLCRRLNHLALNLILERHCKILSSPYSHVSATFNLPKDRLPVAALLLAFFPLSIDSIYCFFEADSSTRDLSRIMYILASKTTASGINLDIESIYLSSANPNLHIDAEKLCNSLLANKPASCRCLSVSDESAIREYLCPSYVPDRYYFTKIGEPGCSFKNTPQRPLNSQRHSIPRILELLAPKSRPFLVLKGLCIKDYRNFLPENIARTLSSMSEVEQLSLPASLRYWGHAWSSILFQIAATAINVKILEIDARRIPLLDLIRFVAHLPKLDSLTILGNSTHREFYRLWHVNDAERARRVTIPSVKFLDATPEYAEVILAHNLPQLAKVRIGVSGNECSLLSPEIRQIFVAISKHLGTGRLLDATSLTFFYSQFDTVSFMLRDLDLYFTSVIGAYDNPLAKFTQLRIYFPFLHMKDASFETVEFNIRVFVQWLKMFKSLRHLKLSNPWDEDLDTSTFYLLIHAIHIQCPGIQVVRLLGKKLNVVQYLSERASVSDSSPGAKCTFGDLNKDVCSLIFQYLNSKELYYLVNLCRNLRNWALPAYLRRRGYPEPNTRICITLATPDILTDISALTLSSLIAVDHLSVCISYESNIPIFVMYEFLRRILRFVLGLVIIKTVEIDFGLTAVFDELFVPRHTKAAWTGLVVSILSASAERSVRMCVFRRGIFGDLTDSPEVCQFSLDNRRSTRRPSSIQVKVCEMAMDSDVLLLPLFRGWMELHLFQSPTIVNFRVQQLCPLTTASFQRAVAQFPMISELDISGVCILPEDILAILKTLFVLRSLVIEGCNFYYGEGGEVKPVKIEGPVPHLPFLRFLFTTAEYAIFLCDDGAGLPELEVLTIVSCSTPASPMWDPLKISKSMSSTVRHLRLRPNFRRLRFHYWGTHNILSLPLSRITNHEWKDVANATKDLVVFYETPFPLLDPQARSLKKWIRQFPGLKCLILMGPNPGHVLDALRSEVGSCPPKLSIWSNGEVWRQDQWYGSSVVNEVASITALGSKFFPDRSAGPLTSYHYHSSLTEATTEP